MKIIIILGPSGSGKQSVIEGILQKHFDSDIGILNKINITNKNDENIMLLCMKEPFQELNDLIDEILINELNDEAQSMKTITESKFKKTNSKYTYKKQFQNNTFNRKNKTIQKIFHRKILQKNKER